MGQTQKCLERWSFYRYSYLCAYERNPPDPILKGGKNPVALGRNGEEGVSYGSIGSPTEMRT